MKKPIENFSAKQVNNIHSPTVLPGTSSDFPSVELLELEEASTAIVSENVFTGCAELGQDASSQVQIFKLGRKL